MGHIKKYSRFVEEFVMTGTETKPAPTTTPAPTTIPRPTRPGIAPTEIPSEEDAPLAAAEKVMDRLQKIYSESPKKEQEKIDSYFEK
jgi:hypothetical protein